VRFIRHVQLKTFDFRWLQKVGARMAILLLAGRELECPSLAMVEARLQLRAPRRRMLGD
jgi:hypothetical protein